MPDGPDLNAVIAGLLASAEEKVGSLLREVLRPVLTDAFQQGVTVGFAMSRESGLRGIEAGERAVQRALTAATGEANHPNLSPRRARRRPRQRVSSGTVRPIVELILSDQPGLRVAEVQAKAAELDDSISPTSIGNELRRHLNKFYRREGKRWFLIGETEQGSGLARLSPVPDPSVGGAGTGAPATAPPASRAA
jgi:hypothetical protein